MSGYDPEGLSMPENLDRYVENLHLLSDKSRDSNPSWVALVDLIDATVPDAPAPDVLRLANALLPVLADAWDAGFKQGGPMHDENYDDPDAHTRNPYRATEAS